MIFHSVYRLLPAGLAALFAVMALALLVAGCGGGATSQPKPATQPLNDTGITACKTEAWLETTCDASTLTRAQDGAAGRDASTNLVKAGQGAAGFDFTRIASNGSVAAESATQWACVKDEVTGLLWEVKSSGANATNARANTYSWYEPNNARNGGDAGRENGGICSGTPCDTSAYAAWANTQALCGVSNWRLPSVSELLSIVDQSVTNPPLDRQFFPNSAFDAHWTHQTVAFDVDNAWYVYFTAANNGAIAKNAVAHIRLVSGEAASASDAATAASTCDATVGASAPAERFTVDNGVTYDTATGLEWRECGASCATPVTWWQALEQANQQPDGWRIPNKKELASIVEYQCAEPALSAPLFNEGAIASDFYWSSTPVVYSSSARAWTVNFATGAYLIRPTDELARVRWVRDSN